MSFSWILLKKFFVTPTYGNNVFYILRLWNVNPISAVRKWLIEIYTSDGQKNLTIQFRRK